MSGGLSGRGSARRRAWQAAGVVLLALGIGLFVIALIGLVSAGGGLALVALAILPIAAGVLAVRRTAGARVVGLSVSLAYAALLASVATGPWRGLTPAPGTEPAPIDPGSALVGLAFLAAAVLLAVGTPGVVPPHRWVPGTSNRRL